MKTLLKVIIATFAVSSLTACVVVPGPAYDGPHYGYQHHHHHHHRDWDRRR